MTTWRRGARLVGSGVGLLIAGTGCGLGDDPPTLVVATTWPPAIRARVEKLYHQQAGARPIHWLDVGPLGWIDAIDRRDGVDLVAGGSPRELLPLLDADELESIEPTDTVPWRVVDLPPDPLDHREDRTPTLNLKATNDQIQGHAEVSKLLASASWEQEFSTLARSTERQPRPTSAS